MIGKVYCRHLSEGNKGWRCNRLSVWQSTGL